MARIHLLEWEDQPWCPASVRNAGTDLVQFVLHAGDDYAPAAPLLDTVPRAESYHREIGEARGRAPIPVTYLIGLPPEAAGEPGANAAPDPLVRSQR